jgi:altronate dehydratase small subunit
MATKRAVILHVTDTVANVVETVEPGDTVDARIGSTVTSIQAVEGIPFGFKISLADVPRGGDVRKYGEVIGRASQPIRVGQLVHVHNLEGARGRGDLQAR